MTRDSAARGGFVLPQTGIFAQGTAGHHFLELDLKAGVEPKHAVASFRRLRAPEVSSGGVNVVVAYSASAWSAVAPPGLVPSGLAPFRTIEGRDGHSAPATQHDAWVWIGHAYRLTRTRIYRRTAPQCGRCPSGAERLWRGSFA